MSSCLFCHFPAKTAQIGIIVGCAVIALGILTCITCYFVRRRKAKKSAKKDAEEGKKISIIGKYIPEGQELKDMSRKISSLSSVVPDSVSGENKQEYDAVRQTYPDRELLHSIFTGHCCLDQMSFGK